MSVWFWILVGWIVAGGVVMVWLWWETKHAPEGFETEHGYGPVSESHSGTTDEFGQLFEWPQRPAEDSSTVRHGGLGR